MNMLILLEYTDCLQTALSIMYTVVAAVIGIVTIFLVSFVFSEYILPAIVAPLDNRWKDCYKEYCHFENDTEEHRKLHKRCLLLAILQTILEAILLIIVIGSATLWMMVLWSGICWWLALIYIPVILISCLAWWLN